MATDQPNNSDNKIVARWVTEYGDALFRFAYFRVGQREIAEDLVQETFIAALKSFDSFEGRSAPKTWLTSILKFKIIDHLRKVSRSVEAVADSATLHEEQKRNFSPDGDWIVRQQRWTREPDQAIEEQQLFQQIHSCLHALPHKLRSLLILRAIDDQDAAQISQDLEIAPAHIWVGLYRARVKVKECLDKKWFKKA